MRIVLKKNYFTDKERSFFSSEDIQVSLFRYETGIEAIRIQNDLGYIVVLPYKGQLIWEAVFNERSLGMCRVNKKDPKPGNFYLEAAFGSYFFHAGALRLGNPGIGDDHPLHGELPYADYESAELLVGKDEKGKYVGLTGTFTYNRGFGSCYEAHPLIKVYSCSSLMDLSMRIDNMSNYPMELMYLVHLNSFPVNGARILQCNPWTVEGMSSRDTPLGGKAMSQRNLVDGFEELNARIMENPRLTEVIRPEDIYDPEIGFYLKTPRTDSEGWTKVMQVLPDGSADFLKYKPEELDHAMRWICLTKDQRGFSLAFPATCGVEGYSEEKRLGNVKMLAPKGSFSMLITAGCVSKEEAEKEEQSMLDIMGGQF